MYAFVYIYIYTGVISILCMACPCNWQPYCNIQAWLNRNLSIQFAIWLFLMHHAKLKKSCLHILWQLPHPTPTKRYPVLKLLPWTAGLPANTYCILAQFFLSSPQQQINKTENDEKTKHKITKILRNQNQTKQENPTFLGQALPVGHKWVWNVWCNYQHFILLYN